MFHVLGLFDIISKFECTVALKNKIARTIKFSYENILKISKRSPNLKDTGGGKEFFNINFNSSSEKNQNRQSLNIKRSGNRWKNFWNY